MLFHSATAGELSDESDDRDGHVAASATMPDDKYCRFCQMYVNGPEQWTEHYDGKSHKKMEAAANKKDREQLEKARKQMSDPPISASIVAKMQPEDSGGIKGLGVVTSSSKATKATSSKVSAAAVPNSSNAASSSPASQGRTYPKAGSEDWASSPEQSSQDSINIEGQLFRPYVLWPLGCCPRGNLNNATYLSDGQYNWVATPFSQSLIPDQRALTSQPR